MTSPKLSLVESPSASDKLSPREKFVTIGACLRASYVERESAVEAVLLAALSGSHALLVGPPGTGKSAVFAGFLKSFVDATQFHTLISRFASEDEIFGPPKLSALKNDKWERSLDGRLAAVHCAFLDEIFKGGDSILNSLLSALNERLYKGAPIPLRMVVAASNELPEEEILAAIYDRFLIRDVVEYIESDATWMRVVSAPPAYVPTVHLTLAEWDHALAEVSAVTLPEAVVREMLRVKKALAAAGIFLSDRRWISSVKVLKAAAWLDGCPVVELDHLAALRFVCWTKPDDRAALKSILGTIDQSAVVACVAVIDEALRCHANRPIDQGEYYRQLPSIASKLQEAAKTVQATIKGGITKRARSRIEPKLAELKAAYDALKGDLSRRFDLNG